MIRVEVIDRDDEVVVRAAVPGYKKEDIEIALPAEVDEEKATAMKDGMLELTLPKIGLRTVRAERPPIGRCVLRS